MYIRFDAMSRSEDMDLVDEGSTTHVHALLGIFLQDGHLPGVFTCKSQDGYFRHHLREVALESRGFVLTEFAVAVDVDGCLYASVNAMGVASPTLAQLRRGAVRV